MSSFSAIESVLSKRVANALRRQGITTIREIKENYPKGLLQIEGFGMHSLRAVEKAFFPEEKFLPAYKLPQKPRKNCRLSENLSNDLKRKPFVKYDFLR